MWNDKEHITLLEARTALATVKHILRSQVGFSRRFLILGDNLGAILALSKGRAGDGEDCVSGWAFLVAPSDRESVAKVGATDDTIWVSFVVSTSS